MAINNNPKKEDNKFKKVKKIWTLRDGKKTSSYTEYRKDLNSRPTRGDYDPKTGQKSPGKGRK